VPRIDLGPEAQPGPEQAPPRENPPPRLEEDLEDFTREGDVDVKVARITLNSRLTGGYDFDGHPGDEGLLVVVEPQNAAGQYVPLPGDLEIEVTDPAQTGPSARLARWTFDSSESAGTIKKSLLGRGMHLQLPWPDHAPKSEKLRVSVRYTPPTGGTFTTHRPIRVDLVARHGEVQAVPMTILPDQLVPTSPPQLSQLLPEQVLMPPNAPLDGPSAHEGPDGPRGRAGQAPVLGASPRRQPTQSATKRRPQWSPYR
jgi:hypothetical protein